MFRRSERVSELLRHEISVWVQGITNPRLGFVTIISVRVSDDLCDAKVYYSVLGNEEEKKISGEILQKSVPRMRHDLGRKLESLRKVPVFTFVYDETPVRAQRVSQILNQLEQEKSVEKEIKNEE